MTHRPYRSESNRICVQRVTWPKSRERGQTESARELDVAKTVVHTIRGFRGRDRAIREQRERPSPGDGVDGRIGHDTCLLASPGNGKGPPISARPTAIVLLGDSPDSPTALCAWIKIESRSRLLALATTLKRPSCCFLWPEKKKKAALPRVQRSRSRSSMSRNPPVLE